MLSGWNCIVFGVRERRTWAVVSGLILSSLNLFGSLSATATVPAHMGAVEYVIAEPMSLFLQFRFHSAVYINASMRGVFRRRCIFLFPSILYVFQFQFYKFPSPHTLSSSFSPSSYSETMVSLKLQKRLAASVLKCGKRKVWLDPNEINEIGNANSRKYSASFFF